MPKPFEPYEFDMYYINEIQCVCGADKLFNSTMCDGCREHLRNTQPALLHVIDNGTGDPLLQAMGEFRELIRSAQ